MDFICFMMIIFEITNALPYHRFRPQINLPRYDDSFYRPQPTFMKISGSIMGAAYYGAGSDPNYGTILSIPDSVNSGGIVPISYDPDSSLFEASIQPNYNQPQQQYNPNSAWQNPNDDINSPYYNRYPPGSPGWYATGGNYWYTNNGQSITTHSRLLLITMAILVFFL